MKFNNAQIYRITNNNDDMVYIGSTCLPLKKRFYNHRKEFHAKKGQNRRLFQHAAKYGWDEFHIFTIEKFPCDSKEELREREEYHRKQVPPEICLNMCRAFVTVAEIKQGNKDSRQKHLAKYNAYMREFQRSEPQRLYRQRWESDNRQKRQKQDRERNQYQLTWGGSRRNDNNLLRIDTTLFSN